MRKLTKISNSSKYANFLIKGTPKHEQTNITTVKRKRRKIYKYVNEFQSDVDTFTGHFYEYSIVPSTFNRIFLNAQILINFLDNMENLTKFAILHTIHPAIVSNQNLKEIKKNI